jgi:hypothetical protein
MKLLEKLFLQSKVLNKIGVSVVVTFAFGFAQAQITSPTPAPGTPNIKVTPMVAERGIPREIEVSGVWPNGCGQVTATLDDSLTEWTGVLVIKMVAPLIDFASACAAPPINYKFSFSFVPFRHPAIVRIAPVFNDGLRRGYGRIVVGYGAPRSSVDINGAWYEPTATGSGFTFVHRYEFDDALFGTWYAYDMYGVARWFVIDSVKWSEDGRTLSGNVSSTKATDACSPGEVACVARGSVDKVAGTIKIDFDGFEPFTDIKLQGRVIVNSLTGALLYRGTILRLGI